MLAAQSVNFSVTELCDLVAFTRKFEYDTSEPAALSTSLYIPPLSFDS